MKWFEYSPDGVTLRIPWTEGGTVVLWLVGFGALLVLALWTVRSWPQQGGAFLRHLSKRLGLDKLPVWLTIPLALLWLALFLNLTYGIFWITLAIPGEAAKSITPEEHADLRWYLLSLTATTAALSAVVALPFTLLRTQFNRRQTETAEQSHITDQINKAVENLGATHVLHDGEGKQFTEPNLEVRVGALYALERISKHSDEDHVQVMEIICAYIRMNAPREKARHPPDVVEVWNLREWSLDSAHQGPRADIKIALDVIGRRSRDRIECERAAEIRGDENTPRDEAGYRLDLRNTNLQKADLRWKNFEYAMFTGSHLQGADFFDSQIKRAAFDRAKLAGAQFAAAKLNGATFGDAELQGANFWKAKTSNANFENADFTGANLGLVSGKHQLTLEQREQSFGIAVDWPSNLLPPSHWLNQQFGWERVKDEWLNWLADPASYVPPQNRP